MPKRRNPKNPQRNPKSPKGKTRKFPKDLMRTQRIPEQPTRRIPRALSQKMQTLSAGRNIRVWVKDPIRFYKKWKRNPEGVLSQVLTFVERARNKPAARSYVKKILAELGNLSFKGQISRADYKKIVSGLFFVKPGVKEK